MGKIVERQNLIPLAAAHVTQLSSEKNGKRPWEVQENITNGLLAVLPRNFTEKEVFGVLNFARKFELLAFNIGMKHMQNEMMSSFDEERNRLKRVIGELEAANTKLADKLGNFIGEEV